MTPDRRAAQREEVTADLDAEEARVWVVPVEGTVAGSGRCARGPTAAWAGSPWPPSAPPGGPVRS
ncbi:hypothetical protein [Nocardiopsis sp. CNT312]|uniref:hypothetical protein n=1 Tax=Nocardiopsis sp. CNT312 TaxID=1137268 RepID=UPI0004901270|nr:hypothetical protein [Nocardiopsis sp. CNT312]